MKPSRLILPLLFVPALALAGCIDLDTADLVVPDEVPDLFPVTRAVLHTAGSADGPGDMLDSFVESLFPDFPVGALRYSGNRAFEPTLGVTSDGTLFLSSFAPSTPKWTLLMRSADQGLTWEDVTPSLGPTSFPPQSNDPYVFVDPDTDRVFLSDLQALVCSTLSFSDDLGESWTMNPIGCGHPFGVHDHQTVFTAKPRGVATVGYPNVVYYCVNRVADSTCATSLNGGLTFGPLRPIVYPGIEPSRIDADPTDPFGTVLSGFCGGLHAHGTSGPDGTVYLPKGHCGYPTVAISKDDGVTWKVVVISDTVKSPGHEVAFATDEAGNSYAFWIGEDRLPYLAVSSDAGETWMEPVMVAPPGVGTTDFPTIAAGADGRIAFAYYGTAAAKPYGEMNSEDTWNAYIGVIADALAESAVIATVTANDPADPVARGICGGGRCNGVGDFIDIVVDAEGRPWGAFVDVCNDECAAADGERNLGVRAFVGTLSQGFRLRGDLEALPALLEVVVSEE